MPIFGNLLQPACLRTCTLKSNPKPHPYVKHQKTSQILNPLLKPPSFPPNRPQIYNGYVYKTLQGRVVDSRVVYYSGNSYKVDSGYAIAPGDADDLSVCGAHPWQSVYLVFADGSACGTAICSNQSNIGNFNEFNVFGYAANFILELSHGQNRNKIWKRLS